MIHEHQSNLHHFIYFIYFSTIFCNVEAFIETPGDIGIELMWHERIRMTLVTLAVVLFDLGLYYYFHDLLLRRYRFSVLTILIGIFSLIICITAVLYIYNVYIVNIGGSKGNGEKKT